ncbi:hypothetical protein VNI00_017868 [Paramarasmius palmivorus]|uniref:NACHT domain-containing protein n=1 Tax=Paramarasmius palmivorus TaxID=297713 RepID=A0AAW0B3Y1_9AGAR
MALLRNLQQLWRTIVPDQYGLSSSSTSPIPVRQSPSIHTSIPPTGVTVGGDHDSTISPQHSSDSSPHISLPPEPSTPTSNQQSLPPSTVPTGSGQPHTRISMNDPLSQVNLSTPLMGVAGGGDRDSTKSPQRSSDSSPHISLPTKPSTPTSNQQSSPPSTVHTGSGLPHMGTSMNDPLSQVNLSTPSRGVAGSDDHDSTISPQHSSDSSPHISLPPEPSTPTPNQRSSPPSTVPTGSGLPHTGISMNDPLPQVNLHFPNVDSNGGFGHTIQGDQINNIYKTENESRAFERLAEKAAPNACYDSEQRFPPPNCHEGTRVQMIADISKWIEDESKTTSILWLHGTAGIGKSAIAQHIAEKYSACGMLGGAFFFSRNDSSRDNIGPFVASLAYQFCKAGSPLREALGPQIIENIARDPNILHTSCENQLQQLILNPCHRVEQTMQNVLPNLLIVDGLDECVDIDEQERVLELLRMLLVAHTFPSWIILLCSRPEPAIRDALHHPSFNQHRISYDMNMSDHLNRDIAKYLNDEFSRLRRKYQRVLRQEGATWPGHHVVNELVERADKQMIFAVTVIKYIDTRDELPQRRLERVCAIFVKAGMCSPYSALDVLYHDILVSCGEWEQVQPILRLLLTPHEPPLEVRTMEKGNTAWRSPAIIAQFLGVQEAQVQVTLDKLHSVLQIPSDDNNDHYKHPNNDHYKHPNNVYIAHATFPEFLGDRLRSAKFFTPKMTQSEYCEPLAMFSLGGLLDLARCYPPYHIEASTEAMLSWGKKFAYMDVALRYLILYGWTLWRNVTSPLSLNLVEALSNLDIYPFITLWCQKERQAYCTSNIKTDIKLEEQIKRAKSQESMPCKVIKRLEEFNGIESLNLAFPPGTQGNDVFVWMWWTGHRCWGPTTTGSGLFWANSPFLPPINSRAEPLLLPLDSLKYGMSVPQNWIQVASVTKENVELDVKLHNAIDREKHMLLEDIRNNTNYSVSEGIVMEDDLLHYRKIIKEHLKIIQGLPVELHDTEDPEAFWSWVDCDDENHNGSSASSSILTSRHRLDSSLSCVGDTYTGWKQMFQWCPYHSKFCHLYHGLIY